MNKNQRELRLTAARKFKQSLEQLDDILQPDTSNPPKNSGQKNGGATSQSMSQFELPGPTEVTGLDSTAPEPLVDRIVEEIDRYIEAHKPE
ncbi:MAG: hypothetical protein QNJ46_31710 [Leptolyngbyaceae cyanobacterium MO_188.B28]|nr:hypothetical protein [Leptolyngbyaceae cyanobacterium MO_188.B28]